MLRKQRLSHTEEEEVQQVKAEVTAGLRRTAHEVTLLLHRLSFLSEISFGKFSQKLPQLKFQDASVMSCI